MLIKVAIILDSVIEREKIVQVIGVHRKLEKLAVSRDEILFHLIGDENFSGFLGASRTCAYFRDSTTEFRIMQIR